MDTSQNIEIYAAQRFQMVQYQLVSRGIQDERVLKVMSEVPRHLFVPESYRHAAYDDCPLPIGEGQTISQPYMVAIMTQCLELKGKEKVLEIGTGSGYQAAILSKLASHIYTIERHVTLASRAKTILKQMEYDNIDVIVGDGSLGLTEKAPFHGIIVTACAPHVPECLLDQLEIGGRLVIPIGDPYNQVLYQVLKTKNGVESRAILECAFVPLIGEEGWKTE
ncbi:MAG: protein-L-isoaspartate(D-aspartate) O-methyltransferase [Candidatus Brocadia sinica]|uniref:protein-L-isoaspartate(D-aspartate) O-methyltransferase n=1 Tax=Candidatus Brocadia sinica TaxID=795830 RepID=UPI0019102AB2|nr:protein-L-isoaspartate(D-aspartate) O-methyltransferase [Candidatus Brocadia sinica]MCK6466928.1 protein-L-isoaspartate(D-aspartate) O-methyltransferase [Candidatus Brocadia sinica]